MLKENNKILRDYSENIGHYNVILTVIIIFLR